MVSFVELKKLAKEVLPEHSTLRRIISDEADYVMELEALPKIEIYARLLHEELETQ